MKRISRPCSTLVLACLVGSCPPANADESSPLSVMQAIERAVAGNPDLRRERVAVAQAAARELEAEGRFDVLLDAALLSCTSPCQDLPLAKTTTTTAALGLARSLETGGTLRLGVSEAASDTTGDSGVLAGTYYSSNLVLTFSHPLLRGFGTEVTLANLRKSRIQHDVAQLGRQMRACNVIRDVVIAYWELAYATQDLAIKRSALDLAQEQLRITQALIGAGRLADSDAASVERAIAQRQEDLATGEQILFFRSLDLQRLFGVPADANIAQLAATDTPSAGTPNVDDPAEIGRALEANPQLRALRLGLRLSQLDLSTARSTLRPRLDFTGSVGPAGFKPDLGDSVKQAAGFGALAWSAGLIFELPVQNRAARGQMQAAEEELNLARLNAEDFAAQLRDLVLRAARSIRTANARVALGRREVEFAQQNLDAERARFQAGRATNNDVLLRQQELKDAETRLLRSTVDQNESEIALAAATAEVLERYGVVLKGL
ncbi:MAG TPA: TolC family protein, partial [Polyangia bacterium]